VRRRALAVEEPGGGEDERPGADRRDPAGPGRRDPRGVRQVAGDTSARIESDPATNNVSEAGSEETPLSTEIRIPRFVVTSAPVGDSSTIR
jgi:hypothetical protein